MAEELSLGLQPLADDIVQFRIRDSQRSDLQLLNYNSHLSQPAWAMARDYDSSSSTTFAEHHVGYSEICPEKLHLLIS